MNFLSFFPFQTWGSYLQLDSLNEKILHVPSYGVKYSEEGSEVITSRTLEELTMKSVFGTKYPLIQCSAYSFAGRKHEING